MLKRISILSVKNPFSLLEFDERMLILVVVWISLIYSDIFLHINDNNVEYMHISKIKLQPNKVSKLNIDGEIKGTTPFELTVIPNEIEIIKN